MVTGHGTIEAAHSAFSVIVPVYNEAGILGETVARLMTALEGQSAQVVYVCNGSVDGSADIVRRVAGSRVAVLELPKASKTAAFNEAERHVTVFPRFYLDADVIVDPGTLPALAEALQCEDVYLVAPRIEFDRGNASWAANAVGEIWSILPHARSGAYHHLLGVSAAGRACWPAFPEVLADDTFIEAMVPRERRRIVMDVSLTTRPPRRFLAWVGVRARWLQGHRELARLGIGVAKAPGQHAALWRLLTHPRTCAKASVYVAARLLAGPVSRWAEHRKSGWFQDRSTRR